MNENLIFNSTSDEPPRSGFIDKNEILKYVTEEDIYELVFGYKPEEYDKVCSPMRVDYSPGAFFSRSPYTDKLLFIDFGDPNNTHYDCFSAVKTYYNLPNFYQTLVFIYNHLIKGQNLTKREQINKTVTIKPEDKRVKIILQTRPYLIMDKIFWERYGIDKSHLLEDRVLPITKYKVESIVKGSYINSAHTLSYAYTDFPSGNKKIYFPYRDGNKRFLTNCSKNDIGGLSKLDFNDPQLVITKSYKDYRVLKNLGYNCIWLQNEGMIPDIDVLKTFIPYFEDIIIFYDNDETGIKASLKVKNFIDSNFGKNCYILNLPEKLLEQKIKDPSDMYYLKGKQELINFLNTNI